MIRSSELNICTECRVKLGPEYLRCPYCNAMLIDASPWKNRDQLPAMIGALLTWLVIQIVFNRFDIAVADLFSDNISSCILLFALYGFFVVLMKWRVTRRQVAAFRHVRQLVHGGATPDNETLEQARHALTADSLGSYNQLIAYQRLQWLVSLTARSQEPRDYGMLAALQQQSDIDLNALESSFAVPNFLIWLLPTAGFLGTVFGMTQALKSFSDVVARGSDLGFTAGLTATAQGLGIAFHTTLIGLAAVIPLLAVTTAVKRKSQLLLEQIDKYFLRIYTSLLVKTEMLTDTAPESGGAGVILDADDDPEASDDERVISTELERVQSPTTIDTY